METTGLSQANQIYINNNQEIKAPTPTTVQVEAIEDGENKMNKALVALGILATAGIAIGCIVRGKKVKTPKNDDVSKLVKQFQDIDFNKGTAKLKDGTLFTGAIEDTLKSGDKVVMEYADGVLQKSTKTTKGAEVVKEYTNGVISKKNGQVVDIKKVQNEVKNQQEKLKKIMANTKLSSDEFQKQANEIKFKSNNDKAEIKKVYDGKVNAEKTAKAEAERLAKEAQEKAQKEETERLAKEAQEKAQKEAKEKAEQQLKKEAQRTAIIQEAIARNKRINAQVDEIMKQDDFDEKIKKLLNTKVAVQKGKYDCTLIETTIGDVLNDSILDEYTKPVGMLYHGTGKTSYQEIMKNGFSFNACKHGESGKGVYFGLKQSGGEKYSTGGLIKAKYTGKKIANVKAGTLESLQYNSDVRHLFEDIFGHEAMKGDSDYLNTEILNRIYIKKLSNLGYDAVHSMSAGAGCEYIAILNPAKIKIID